MPQLLRIAGRHLPPWLRNPLRAAWRNLPPRDRRYLLQDLEDPNRRAAFLNSPHYRYFAQCEMRHWSDYQERQDEAHPQDEVRPEGEAGAPAPVETPAAAAPAARNNYFTEHPLVLAEFKRRVMPEQPDSWLWLARQFGGRDRGLVLGAGKGDHCRILIDHKIVRHVMAYDLAEGSVRRANAAFRRLGYPIEYSVGDLNFVALERAKFDLCMAMYSLHHVIDLEGLAVRVARALDPERGVFASEDYVGPRYVELPPAARRVVQGLFEKLPEHLRRGPDGQPMRRLHIPDRWEVQADSPFEAVRSDRILDAFKKHFEFEIFNEMGCGVLTPLLSPIIYNFDPAREEDNRVLRELMEADWELTRQRIVPNFFAFMLARPHKR